MSPRRRKAEDADVFAAMGRVMRRVGPAELTLGAIAAEAGVTAGALVQRFGSKRADAGALASDRGRGRRPPAGSGRAPRFSPAGAASHRGALRQAGNITARGAAESRLHAERLG